MIVRPARNLAEIALHQRARFGGVDVAGEHDYRVVRPVIVAKPLAHVLERSLVQVRHRTDGRVAIGMALRKQTLEDAIESQPVRLVVALALLVLNDAALRIEPLLRQRAEDVAHALALDVEAALQRRRRHGLEVIGAVEPSGAVPIGGAHFAQRLDQVRHVLGAVEQHDVFEQVRESGLSRGLVLGADIVPRRDRHHRRLAVLVHDDGKTVVELELLVADVDAREQLLHRSGLAAGAPALTRARARRQRERAQDRQCSPRHGLPQLCWRALARNRPPRSSACDE
jgi:hypothetical protein